MLKFQVQASLPELSFQFDDALVKRHQLDAWDGNDGGRLLIIQGVPKNKIRVRAYTYFRLIYTYYWVLWSKTQGLCPVVSPANVRYARIL